uniref:Uncharacterized protein n=1 Tax=Panagrolaimus superbus TaxID=310955 RepID=A0A914ZB44_9BILA
MAVFEKLESEYPNYAPIYSAEIERLSKAKKLPELKKMVEKLLEIIESKKVAEFFGVKSEFSEENLQKKEKMETKKAAIINALFFQANLFLDSFLKITNKDIPAIFRNGFKPKKDDGTENADKKADKSDNKECASIEKIDSKSKVFEDIKVVNVQDAKEAIDKNDGEKSTVKDGETNSINKKFVIQNDKEESADKKNFCSNDKISRNSVSSNDSFDKVEDSGIDSDDKTAFSSTPKKKESDDVASISETSISSDIKIAKNAVPKSNIYENETTSTLKNLITETVKTPNDSNEKLNAVASESESYNSQIIVNDQIPKESDPKSNIDNFRSKIASESEKIEKTENTETSSSEVSSEEVEKVFRDYMLFVDSTSENARIIQAKYAVAHERYGTALKQLEKIIIDKATTSDYLSTEKAVIEVRDCLIKI